MLDARSAYNLFRGEWRKITGHRWASTGFIWVFPVGAFLFTLLYIVILLFDPAQRASFAASYRGTTWITTALTAWFVPNSELGRFVLFGFTAIIFAGEYQWETWKNIIPRRRRTALILNKFFTLGVFIVVAFTVMSIIMTVNFAICFAIAGIPFDPPISAETLTSFGQQYLQQAGLAFLVTMIISGFTALAAILTRSMIGAVTAAFVFTVAEQVSIIWLLLLSDFFKNPDLVALYQWTPSYNLRNALQWLTTNQPVPFMIRPDVPPFEPQTLEGSIAILVAWSVGLILLTILIFRRQDIQ